MILMQTIPVVMKHKMDYVQKCVSWFSRWWFELGGLFHKPGFTEVRYLIDNYGNTSKPLLTVPLCSFGNVVVIHQRNPEEN